MADINKLAPIIAKWEGGFVNDPIDRGGATNMGITLSTWQKIGYDKDHDGHIDADDVKLLTSDDFKLVLRKYWDSWKADQIKNQSIANILVDWVWASGAWGIKIPQRLLGLKEDGVVGIFTLGAVNTAFQEDLFNRIKEARIVFANNICLAHPDQKRFIKGWTNRIEYFKFQS